MLGKVDLYLHLLAAGHPALKGIGVLHVGLADLFRPVPG
jgi:hypothetical protein